MKTRGRNKTKERRAHLGEPLKTERLFVRMTEATKAAIFKRARLERLPAASWAERILNAAALAP